MTVVLVMMVILWMVTTALSGVWIAKRCFAAQEPLLGWVGVIISAASVVIGVNLVGLLV